MVSDVLVTEIKDIFHNLHVSGRAINQKTVIAIGNGVLILKAIFKSHFEKADSKQASLNMDITKYFGKSTDDKFDGRALRAFPLPMYFQLQEN